MSLKPLWEYNHGNRLFEVELNHLANFTFASWEQFIKDETNARNCNCTIGSPLLYWVWSSPCKEGDEDYEDREDRDSDIVELIFASWFSSLSRFRIKVQRSDEPLIRQFIKDHQQLIAV